MVIDDDFQGSGEARVHPGAPAWHRMASVRCALRATRRMRTAAVCAIAFVSVLAGCAGLPRQKAPDWPLPDGIQVRWVDGYPLAYKDEGSGTPVVLVHGALNDYRAWGSQAPEFARSLRVITVSLRHFYPERWSGQGGGFLITDHARDVAALIRSLDLGKVHLIGHSRGGAVALNTARLSPELIRTLTLADPSGLESLLPDTPQTRALAAQTRQLVSDLRANYATGDIEKTAREFVDALGGPGTWSKRTPEQKQMTLDNLGTAAGDTGERPPVACQDIARFDFPVLLVNGQRSPRRYAEMMSAMRACKPSIPPAVVIPEAAHAMNRDNPARFNAVTLEFLTTH